MQIPKDPNGIVEAALRFEEEGHKILSDAKERANHPLSKATFQFLADQELRHIETIKQYARSLAHHGGFEIVAMGQTITKRQAGEEIKGLFAQFKPHFEETELGEDRLEIYDVALDMERHGHDFYKEAASLSEDETARKLYEFLANEETRHFEIIQDTRDFLAQPDAFMAIDENWMTS